MTLTEREVSIIHSVLPRLKNCEQIQLVLKADFYPNHENKDKLNPYSRNSLIEGLVYPWAKLFFVGQLHFDVMNNPNLIKELEVYLKANLQKMRFSSGWLSGITGDKD